MSDMAAANLAIAQLQSGKFDVQFRAFCRGDVEVSDEAVAITIVGDVKLLTRGNEGFAFGIVFVGQKSLRCEIVFDFGEGGQHRLTVIGRHFTVRRLGEPQARTQPAT